MSDQPRLLAVDDEKGILTVIRVVGQKAGYEVITLTDPQQFLDQAASWSPHVILMDLHMPDVDSADLLRALAAAGCEAEILLMSGADQATLRKVQALGASLNLRMTQILAKPLRAEGFRTALNACAASTAGG